MAGGLFSRVKTWASLEALTNEDLNAEFDNIIANFLPTKMDDYSVTVVQMQIQTSPGGVGTESQATSLAGEIERLRFVINRIIGSTYWYEAPATNLSSINTLFTSFAGLPNNRIESGRIRSTDSGQANFLVANGAARTVTLAGSSTPFVYRVAGVQYTISTDVTQTSLTAAPSSNNTCLVNDSLAADQHDTRFWGAPWHRRSITVDAMGSEITSLVGKFAAFKINNGSSDEYFLAFVQSATQLTKVFRGFFFNSSGTPVKPIVFSDNDVITLQKLTFVFAKTDGTLDVCYTNPTWSYDEPSSPAIGDFWFDMANDVWKKTLGAGFFTANATLVGVCIQDTANTVAAHSFEFYSVFKDDNTFSIEKSTNSIARASNREAVVSVGNKTHSFGHHLPTWNMAADLAGSTEMFDATEQASRFYYLYVKQTGDLAISDIFPYYKATMLGWYHPYNVWRCVGLLYNDASSNILVAQSVDSKDKNYEIIVQGGNGVGATDISIRRFGTLVKNTSAKIAYVDSAASGTELKCGFPGTFKIGYSENWNNGGAGVVAYGLSVNSTQLTTAIGSIALADVVGYVSAVNANGAIVPWSDTVKGYLGDTFRPHFGGTAVDGSDEIRLTVSDLG